MSYFAFLLYFLAPPVLVFGALHWLAVRRGEPLPAQWRSYPPWLAVSSLMVIALLYTTPWDNYLIATGVWWYERRWVSGLTFGWVPIEEYLFFLLQPLATGLCLLWVVRVGPAGRPFLPASTLEYRSLREQNLFWLTSLFWLAGLFWVAALGVFVIGWQPGTYLALQWIWVMPPLLLQLWVGGDLLWQARRPLLVTVSVMTLYLSLADTVAIQRGLWTIDPQQSLQLWLGGLLPLEEALFFLHTNLLVVSGICLFLHPVMLVRLAVLRRRWLPMPLGPLSGKSLPGKEGRS